MRYRLLVVGRLKRGFFAEGCRHYLARLGALAKVEVIELREARGTADEIRAKEGAALLSAATGHRVALDERGDAWRSRTLARHIGALENRSISQLSLIVGGAEGLDRSLIDAVEERWRLSDLTLPHELARLVLLEQLYRAETLRAGHPYHRE